MLPTGTQINNCIHEGASAKSQRVPAVAAKTTNQSGKCPKNLLHKSFVLTGPLRPTL